LSEPSGKNELIALCPSCHAEEVLRALGSLAFLGPSESAKCAEHGLSLLRFSSTSRLIAVGVRTDDETWRSICEYGDPSEVAEMVVRYCRAKQADEEILYAVSNR